MNQQARDMRYGRQGGRVVPFDQTQAGESGPCDVCGRPSLLGRHRDCVPVDEADQGSLL